MTNQTARVLELLKRFNNNEKICIEVLQNDPLWEGKSEKTIRRDLDVIKEYFPDSFELIRGGKGEKGCYSAITKDAFNNFMSKDTIALMVQTFNIAQRNNMLKNLDISDTDKRIIENKINKSKACYEFITKPFELKKNDELLLKDIERAISGRRYSAIEYDVNGETRSFFVKPYKILFMNESFYLACENTTEEFLFTIFRLAHVKSIRLDPKTFQVNPDISDFIKEMQTPFSTYKPSFRLHQIYVVVEVDVSKAKYFRMKKYLPSQQISESKDNGNIIVEYKVTQEIEVEELIKKWLPYMRVIEPMSLKDKIDKELREYLGIDN